MTKNEIVTNETIKRVHVVFMTHFDMGFTDLADRVLSSYIQDFIPEAIRLAMDLNQDGRKRFIWTLGAFLIDRYLKKIASGGSAETERCIDERRYQLAWTGLYYSYGTDGC